MGSVRVMSTGPATLSEFGLRRVLTVLCVTEIISWGVLYYAFPVLAPSIAADTGWSIATITAAFSTVGDVRVLLGRVRVGSRSAQPIATPASTHAARNTGSDGAPAMPRIAGTASTEPAVITGCGPI